MNYFRAVYLANELSSRSLCLTAEAIFANPGKYCILTVESILLAGSSFSILAPGLQVWHFRRKIGEALNTDLFDELIYIEGVAKNTPKNYQI